jgi:hypothetical protein
MAKILHLEIVRLAEDGERTSHMAFEAFPVRIGRDPVNECQLLFPFVSRVHARLELRGETLVLRDEGGRNGVIVGGERLAPGTEIDLLASGGQFEISWLQFRARLEEFEDDDDVRSTPHIRNAETELAIEAVSGERNATCLYAEKDVDPTAVDESAVLDQLRPLFERRDALLKEVDDAIRASLATIDGGRRVSILRRLREEQPANAPPSLACVEQKSYPPAELALQSMLELAALFAPNAPPLGSTACVAAFHQRLEIVLRTLLDGFIALRASYRCETGATGDADRALNGVDFGAQLLDWTSDSDAAVRALEHAFAEMSAYHARLVGDVVLGVERLRDELAPHTIEANALTVGWGGRWRGAWREFGFRYDALFGDAQRVDGVFGPVVERARASLLETSGMHDLSESGPRVAAEA